VLFSYSTHGTLQARNTLWRCGTLDENWKFGVGAVWFYALDAPMVGARVLVADCDVRDSPFEALHVMGGGGHNVSGLEFSNTALAGAGTFALQLQTGGAATFANVSLTGALPFAPVYSCGPCFSVSVEAGDAVTGAWLVTCDKASEQTRCGRFPNAKMCDLKPALCSHCGFPPNDVQVRPSAKSL
jgi:hypothetical protein